MVGNISKKKYEIIFKGAYNRNAGYVKKIKQERIRPKNT